MARIGRPFAVVSVEPRRALRCARAVTLIVEPASDVHRAVGEGERTLALARAVSHLPKLFAEMSRSEDPMEAKRAEMSRTEDPMEAGRGGGLDVMAAADFDALIACG